MTTNQREEERRAARALVEHLLADDHNRGCGGRCYSCECGYDDKTHQLADMLGKILSPKGERAPIPQPDPHWITDDYGVEKGHGNG
jgi:hypothetical protein